MPSVKVNLPKQVEPLVKHFEEWAAFHQKKLEIIRINGSFIMKVKGIVKLVVKEI